MIRRVFNVASIAAFWTAMVCITALGLVALFDMRPNGVLAVAAVVGLLFVLGCICWHEFRLFVWSCRWRWWAHRMREFVALQDDRRSRGLCPSCGYDLTGNLSGTCPECGSAAPTTQV
jgi:hypothetical protein